MTDRHRAHERAKQILDHLAQAACVATATAACDLLALSEETRGAERATLIQLARDVQNYGSITPSSALADKRAHELGARP